MESLAENILTVPSWAVYLLVFLIPALEASAFVGFVFPGEIACLLGGVAAFEGGVSLTAVTIVAILGAVIGDSVGYAIGRRFGESLLRRLPQRVVKPEHVAKSKAAINRLGGKAVFVGRFTAALRVLVPGLCGMAGMRYRTFAAWNVAGGVIWAGGSVALGFLAGTGWRRLSHDLTLGGFLLAGFVVAGVAAYLLSRRWRNRRLAARTDVPDGAGRDGQLPLTVTAVRSSPEPLAGSAAGRPDGD